MLSSRHVQFFFLSIIIIQNLSFDRNKLYNLFSHTNLKYLLNYEVSKSNIDKYNIEKILTIFRWVIGFLGVAIGSIPFLAMLISEEKIIRSDSYINSSLIILALGIFLITLNFFKNLK